MVSRIFIQNKQFLNRFIWPIDKNRTGTTPSQNRPGGYNNEDWLGLV